MNITKYCLWIATGLLLVSNIPLFLSMPLTADAVLYDLQARCLLEGGVLYRDLLEPNLPGIVWCHAFIRSTLGWSTSVLRFSDLLLVGCSLGMLCHWVNLNSSQRTMQQGYRSCTCFLISWFYLGTSEWCHCQRDTWMLAPALLGLTIYYQTLCRLRKENFQGIRLSYFPILATGFLFGIAFWLKPFVAVPIMSMLVVSKLYIPRWFNFMQITLTIISGGLIAGILGICWMINSGCWPYFLETLTQWNPDYYQAGRSRWTLERFSSHCSRFWPWVLLYLPFIYLLLKHFYQEVQKAYSPSGVTLEENCSTSLLQAFTLGWLVQAFAFQQLFDYIHVPGIILVIAVILKSGVDSGFTWVENGHIHKPFLVVFVLFITAVSNNTSTFKIQKLQHWPSCIIHGFEVPAAVKDDLCHWPLPRWQELEQVVKYVKSQNVGDREVLAYNGSLIQIYPILGMHAPTRFAYLDVHARCFPNHRQEMSRELDTANPRLIICNLEEDGFPSELVQKEYSLNELQQLLSETTTCFPYNQELVFRSNNYLVYRKVKDTGELTSSYRPLAGFSPKSTIK